MGPERTAAEPESQSKETTETAIRLLAAALASCRELGVQASIGVHGLSREVFDRLEDYTRSDHPGIQIAPDPENPMWWKRAPGRIHIYTQEPPMQQASPRDGEPSTGRPHAPGEN